MNTTRILAILMLAWAMLPAAAAAESDPAEAEAKRDHMAPLGERTRAWLERQREGREASPGAHGLAPPAERRARQRYLDSFEHPIPDLFDLDEAGDR